MSSRIQRQERLGGQSRRRLDELSRILMPSLLPVIHPGFRANDHAALKKLEWDQSHRVALERRRQKEIWAVETQRIRSIKPDRPAPAMPKLSPIKVSYSNDYPPELPEQAMRRGNHMLSPIRRVATHQMVLKGFRGSKHGIEVKPVLERGGPNTSRDAYFKLLRKQRRKNTSLPSMKPAK